MEQMIVYQDRLNLHSEHLSLHVRDGMEPKAKDFADAGVYAVFPCDGERFEPFVEQIFAEWFSKGMYTPGDYYLVATREEGASSTITGAAKEIRIPVTYAKPPHCANDQSTWTTAAQAVREAMKFTPKKDHTLIDVMGYTGHAFRININENNADVAGPTAWDWGPVFQADLLRLGIRASYAGEPNFTPPTPELLGRAIEKVQQSLDRGIPAVAWDLLIPEFGVIYGYDDEKQVLYVKDVSGEGELPYSKLGRGQIGELFVLTLDDFFEIGETEALTGALKSITEYARIRYHRHPEPPYQNGLAGYDAWIKAFRNRSVDPFGNAYNAAVICDARAFAVQFLQKWQRKWSSEDRREQELSRFAEAAAACYQEVFDALVQLPPLYPFPQGGNPNLDTNAEFTIQVLQRAKAAEERGVETLENMLQRLQTKDV